MEALSASFVRWYLLNISRNEKEPAENWWNRWHRVLELRSLLRRGLPACSSFVFLNPDTDVGMSDSSLGLCISSNFYKLAVHICSRFFFTSAAWRLSDIYFDGNRAVEHPRAPPFPLPPPHGDDSDMPGTRLLFSVFAFLSKSCAFLSGCWLNKFSSYFTRQSSILINLILQRLQIVHYIWRMTLIFNTGATSVVDVINWEAFFEERMLTGVNFIF